MIDSRTSSIIFMFFIIIFFAFLSSNWYSNCHICQIHKLHSKWLKFSVLYGIIHLMKHSTNTRASGGGRLNGNHTRVRKGSSMKKTALIALFALMILSLFGCGKKPEVSYVDTLPCDQASGYTWVARASSDNTGQVYIGQTYRDDETYTFLGASGVLENAFAGVTPGVATVRLYYVHALDWDGSNSSAEGTAYYEFMVYDDLSIRLMYSEIELPDEF